MTTGPDDPKPLSAGAWLWATFLGWYLGFAAVVALILPADLLGGGIQSVVGIGMGLGLGHWQSRLLRGVLPRPRLWTWTMAAGLGAPFLAWDLAALSGAGGWFSAPACIVAGGLFAGLLQWRLLAPRFPRAVLWIPASTAGWALPALVLALGSPGLLEEPWARATSLAGMFLGGLMLGLVTCRPMARLLAAP